MKKIILALLLVLAVSHPAFAVFSSKGVIPEGEPIEYRGLKITSDGVSIIIVNRGDERVAFSANCAFVGENVELGDFFIEEMALDPQEHKQLKNLYLKGDFNLCKKAESLRWTIYTLKKTK